MKQVQLIGLTQEENNKPIFEYFDKKIDDLEKRLVSKTKVSKYMTTTEVIQFLRISRPTLHNWRKCGKLKSYNVVGKVLFDRVEVETLVTNNKI